MVQVAFSGIIKKAAGGVETVEIEAANIRQLLTRLGEQMPALKPHIDKGVAVSIDGEIYRDAWFKEIPPDAEVFIIPRLAGG